MFDFRNERDDDGTPVTNINMNIAGLLLIAGGLFLLGFAFRYILGC